MRILLAAPAPPNDGNRVRLKSLVQAIEGAGHNLSLLATDDGGRYSSANAADFTLVHHARIPALARSTGALVTGGSLRTAYYKSPALRRAFTIVTRRANPDIILLKRLRMRSLIDYAPVGVPVILDLTDSEILWSLRTAATPSPGIARFRAMIDLPGSVREETDALRDRRISMVTLASDRDRSFLHHTFLIPRERMIVLPNVVSNDWLAIPLNDVRAGTLRLLFIGDCRQQTNRDAAQWLVESLWPEISRRHPTATLTLAGAGTERFGRNGTRVRALGFVPEAKGLFLSHTASIAPLRAGAGVKYKVLQSAAAGVPVLGTPIAFEGLNRLIDTGGLIIAQTPHEFAEACDQLPHLLNADTPRRLQRTVAEHFSVSALGKAFDALAMELISASPPTLG